MDSNITEYDKIISLEMNDKQTPITPELLHALPKEVENNLIDYINTVPYIKSLIAPNRPLAKDLPRDEDGKIIIDLTKPHLLENMDYFRPSALHYLQYGNYTELKPNANPNSAYGKWIRQELDRCWNGMIRKSDGEWITGPMYFFLNYSVMEVTKTKKGSKQGYRIQSFPEVWEGIYYRFHYLYQARYGGIYNDFKGGNHCAELASRGKGKSYSLSSLLAHNFVLGEAEEAKTNIMSAVVADNKEYLSSKDGTLSKFINIIDFCAEHTQFPRRRILNSIASMTWKMGYKDAELNIDKGTQNTVIGVTINDDIKKIRGKRMSLIGIEEYGSFPKLIDLYAVMKPSVQEGDYVFGMIYMVGTAGDKDSDFYGAREIMYNPKGYNIYNIPNIYDKININKKDFIYFFPGYLNRKGCYDENGNSDVIKALIEILLERYNIKYHSTDPNTLLKNIAEVPITPSEAILKANGNLFPTTDITERIGQLDANPSEFDDVYVGDLVFKDDKIIYTPTNDNSIREFPHKDNKINGAIEIFEMPKIDRDNKVFRGRYIAGLDPVDDDTSETMSLLSIFVLDLWTDKIVCEWTGRLSYVDDGYERIRKICLFYNAVLNYENNKKGIFAYFSKMNCLYLLAPTLEFLKDKDMIKSSSYINNKSFGVNASASINNYARHLLREWLIKPVVTTSRNEQGELITTTKPLLYTIRNRALLKELLLFNSEGNFDRISAMGMLMLYREDRIVTLKDNLQNTKVPDNYLGNDKFFTQNYNNYQNRYKKYYKKVNNNDNYSLT